VAVMAKSNRQVCAGWLEINRNWTGFIMRQLQEDAALVHQLAKCRNALDVCDVYSDVFHRVLLDFQRQIIETMQRGQSYFTDDVEKASPASDVGEPTSEHASAIG
jgi:hypothetical protein